jgi:hypothetical protein
MARAVGIDLGTTNSVVCVLEGGEPTVIANAEGARTTPSIVAFAKNGEVLVGEVAKRQSVTNVERTIRSVKRHMGTNWKIGIDGKDYTSQEISARILQKLKRDAESYLGETITDEELLTLPPSTILRRLFLEESAENGVRSFPPRPISFACRCSRTKVADVLRMLGEEEVQSILAEQGLVETICDFCAKPYRFDAVDCLQVFKTDLLSDATRPPSRGH